MTVRRTRVRHGRRAGGRHRILPRDHRADRRALHRRGRSHELIQEYKNQGGWNDDWELSHQLDSRSRRAMCRTTTVVDQFNEIFLGDERRWPDPARAVGRRSRRSVRATCASDFRLAIFTGRCGRKLTSTLNRFAPECAFDPIVAEDDVNQPEARSRRPARYQSAAIRSKPSGTSATRSTTRAARRRPECPFIGIAAPSQSALRRTGLPASAEQARSPSWTTSMNWRSAAPHERSHASSANTKETQIGGSSEDRRPGPLRHLHRHPLLRSHAGAVHQARRLRSELHAKGDLDVDQHHTVEDVGIVLGQLFSKALGDRNGINRAGYFVLPMDETLAVVALDLGGRPGAGLQEIW